MDNNGIPIIKLYSNRKDEAIETGSDKPPLFCSEDPTSCILLVDSDDRRLSIDTPFKFCVSTGVNLFRPRSIKLSKAILPKINNITPFNNQMQIFHSDLGGTITAVYNLQPAFYNTTTLANEITQKTNAAFLAAGITDTITTSFDSVTKTFSISSVNVEAFYIVNNCSFIERGRYCAPFKSEAIGSIPSTTTIYTSMAGMLYTRSVSIHSLELCAYAYAQSLATNTLLGNNIVAIIDIAAINSPEDFDVSIPFSGNFSSIDTSLSASQINVTNSQKNLYSNITFEVKDEYGENLQDVMNLGGNYPANSLGITMWFLVRF